MTSGDLDYTADNTDSGYIKLGSLFDGSGGFPLAGTIHGIRPVWASEIEPYPLRVTAARFPRMKQLGDVTKIKGAEIEPVDIITFGSPCQDLSVAGKQKGIHEGERSNLFFEAIRIIREMRENDKTNGRSGVDIRPRFAVWENVLGAFSSNEGRDFQAVLQALCEIADFGVHVPRPPRGVFHTVNTQDRHVVAFDCRNMRGNDEISGTLHAKNEGGFSLNFINPVVYSSGAFGSLSEGVGCLGTGTRATAEMVAVYDTTQITCPNNYSNPKPGDPCHPLAAQQHPPLAVQKDRQERKYIVRRLTPLECCRLQGFPDWWEDGVKGRDSARYKMWGNGIALPCAVDVLGRIVEFHAKEMRERSRISIKSKEGGYGKHR